MWQMSNRISGDGKEGRLCDATQIGDGQVSQKDFEENRSGASQGSQHEKQSNRESGTIPRQCNTQKNRMGTCEKCGKLKAFKGYGTALKPTYEPIILAMKPIEGAIAQNAEKWQIRRD